MCKDPWRVADVRLGLQVLMGAHPRDPWSIDAPFKGRDLTGPIRVAVMPSPPGGDVDSTVSDVVRRAAGVLADAGYDVVEACPPRYEEAVEVWARLIAGDFASVLTQLAPIMGADAMAFYDAFDTVIPPLADSAAFSQLLAQRDGIAREWSIFMEAHSLVLTPTSTQLSFEHGFDAASTEGAIATKIMQRPLVSANLLGLPSACVPAGRDESTGLPVGVLLTGQRFREDLCLDAAEAVETRLGLTTPIDPIV